MKNTIVKALLICLPLVLSTASAADLVCNLYVKAGGNVFGNGTSSCFGIDFSFGSSTSGSFTITNISKSIQEVQWSGAATCNGGTTCGVTVRAYATTKASALILYKDGTWERTNTARISYETGH